MRHGRNSYNRQQYGYDSGTRRRNREYYDQYTRSQYSRRSNSYDRERYGHNDDIYRDSYRDFEDTFTGKVVNKMTADNHKQKETKQSQKTVVCKNVKFSDSKKRGRYRNLRTGEVVTC